MSAPWTVVDVSESSDVYSSSESSISSSESPKAAKKRKTMRMPPARNMPVARGSAAVGASSSKEAYTVVRGSAAVGASSSKIDSPPFEAESQERELSTSFRAAIREHGRTGGSPPPVPAINAASGKPFRSRAPSPDRASRGPEKKELDKAEDDKSAVGEKSSVGGSSAVGDESAGRGEATPKNVLLTSSEDVQKDVDPQWVKKCISESLESQDNDVFSKTSPLSKATDREMHRSGSEVGTHCCPGEAVFLTFEVFSGAGLKKRCQRHGP